MKFLVSHYALCALILIIGNALTAAEFPDKLSEKEEMVLDKVWNTVLDDTEFDPQDESRPSKRERFLERAAGKEDTRPIVKTLLDPRLGKNWPIRPFYATKIFYRAAINPDAHNLLELIQYFKEKQDLTPLINDNKPCGLSPFLASLSNARHEHLFELLRAGGDVRATHPSTSYPPIHSVIHQFATNRYDNQEKTNQALKRAQFKILMLLSFGAQRNAMTHGTVYGDTAAEFAYRLSDTRGKTRELTHLARILQAEKCRDLRLTVRDGISNNADKNPDLLPVYDRLEDELYRARLKELSDAWYNQFLEQQQQSVVSELSDSVIGEFTNRFNTALRLADLFEHRAAIKTEK